MKVLCVAILATVATAEWTGTPTINDEHITLPDEATFYTAATTIEEVPIGSEFHVQYAVKTPSELTCGGSYIKVGHRDDDEFNKATPYDLMFGSDAQCNGDHTIHAILYSQHKPDKNHPTLERIAAPLPTGEWHVYRFSVFTNHTFAIVVDNETKASGELEDYFPLLEPKLIPDVEDEQPDDWDDRPVIEDASVEKPDDWDEDAPAHIVNPDAVQPDDWDDDDDGEWEPPTMPNPEYKGKFHRPTIENPAYQGQWVPRKVQNPEYVPDADLLQHITRGINFIGIDVWTMTPGIEYYNPRVMTSIEDVHAHVHDIQTFLHAPVDEL